MEDKIDVEYIACSKMRCDILAGFQPKVKTEDGGVSE